MKRSKNGSHLKTFAAIFTILVFAITSPAMAKTLSIKFGTYDPPLELGLEKTNGEFASTNVKGQAFKDMIEKRSAGAITVKVFPSGQLGNDREEIPLR